MHCIGQACAHACAEVSPPVLQEVVTTWPLGVSLGTAPPQFQTPAVHCAAANAYAAVMSAVSGPAASAMQAATNGEAANGAAAAGSELWVWTGESSGTSIIRNARRQRLPAGAVSSLHPVGRASTYVDPGPVEAARLRGAQAAGMAKASGLLGPDSLNLPSPEAAAADASPPTGAAPGALGFVVVFQDGSLVHVAAPGKATEAEKQTLVATRLLGPEPSGSSVAATAHSRTGLVVITAVQSAPGAVVHLYTAEVRL